MEPYEKTCFQRDQIRAPYVDTKYLSFPAQVGPVLHLAMPGGWLCCPSWVEMLFPLQDEPWHISEKRMCIGWVLGISFSLYCECPHWKESYTMFVGFLMPTKKWASTIYIISQESMSHARWSWPHRSCTMVALVTALGGLWSLEQPSGSVLEYYPTWRHLMAKIFENGGVHSVPKILPRFFVVDCLYLFAQHQMAPSISLPAGTCASHIALACFHRLPFPTKVTTVRWWMGHYNAPTPKRHWGASNSPLIRKIDKGVLQGWKKKVYFDASGQIQGCPRPWEVQGNEGFA